MQSERVAVTTKQALEFCGLRRKVGQGGFHGIHQLVKLGKVLIMRRLLLGLAPQVFNRVIVGL